MPIRTQLVKKWVDPNPEKHIESTALSSNRPSSGGGSSGGFRPEHGVSKLADEAETEALKAVLLDEFVEVHRQQFECDARVSAESEMFQHVHHVERVIDVQPSHVIQDTNLFLRLSDSANRIRQ